MDDSLVAWDSTTNAWKNIVYPQGPFFPPHSQKVLNFGFPGRRDVWEAGLEKGLFFRSAITPDLCEIFLEGFATAAV